MALQLSQLFIASWDLLPNKFYKILYVPWPIHHLDARILDKKGNSEPIIMPNQAPIVIIEELIFTLVQLYWLPHRRPLYLYPEEVRILPFPEGYLHPALLVYNYTNPFKHQYRVMT